MIDVSIIDRWSIDVHQSIHRGSPPVDWLINQCIVSIHQSMLSLDVLAEQWCNDCMYWINALIHWWSIIIVIVYMYMNTIQWSIDHRIDDNIYYNVCSYMYRWIIYTIKPRSRHRCIKRLYARANECFNHSIDWYH